VAYIAPKDFTQDPELLAKLMKTLAGDLELDWMGSISERLAARPSQPRFGLTLDDINQGAYSPDRSPEIVRHNFSMAPRGAILPKGLPSLGYRLNRKSELWADVAAAVFEEGKSRRWAPARDVRWEALEQARYTPQQRAAIRQLATSLQSIGLVAADVAAKWEWLMNQEFHEVKYLMCLQMIDGARIVEAFRKRALYGEGSLGVDFPELGELLKIVFESGTYPCASASLNLLLFSTVQALGRHLEWAADNAADRALGTFLAQDATRFVAYGVDHLRSLLRARPGEAESLNGHLDQVENGWIGLLGARPFLEPLVVLSGGFEPVAALYERTAREYFERCAAAGLGDRRGRSPVPAFVGLFRQQGES
jgi:hypothetical protein